MTKQTTSIELVQLLRPFVFVIVLFFGGTSVAMAACQEDPVPSWSTPIDADVQYQLAERLWSGDDCYVPDYSRSAKLYRLSAEQGYAPAQVRMGRFYARGLIFPEDKVTASNWFRLAAEQGYADGQVQLADAYRFGDGVLQNYQEAARWSRLAAEQGNSSGQFNLGYMHREGQGVLQDNVLAHMWFNIASANGEGAGSRGRDELASTMASGEIAMAQTMARECMSSGYTKCGY